MYKLLIVDDEDLEREGMAEFIPWADYDVELVGTAWNGVDGFEKIQVFQPDIVLTDIKMPVMNGIELIQKTHETMPYVEFIVLSGYGEYEYTSQAMQEGIRHYLLKPCDEQKIVKVLNALKEEIVTKQEKKKEEKTVKQLLPRAKEEIFRNILLGKEQTGSEYKLLVQGIKNGAAKIRLLAFRTNVGFDYLEQFILGNMLRELLGEDKVLLSTGCQQVVIFLLATDDIHDITKATERVTQEFKRVKVDLVQTALSRADELERIGKLYEQIQELFSVGELEHKQEMLHQDKWMTQSYDSAFFFHYQRLKAIKSYRELLQEVYFSFLKMEVSQLTQEQMECLCRVTVNTLYKETVSWENIDIENAIFNTEAFGFGEKAWILFVKVVTILSKKQFGVIQQKEEEKNQNILLAIYHELRNPEMSVQYLAKEILFMNEDYFGRFFLKKQGVRFSMYLLEIRTSLAKRLLDYNPELKIAELAELVGYPADAQYFSKTFRKMTGMSPTEYREKVKNDGK